MALSCIEKKLTALSRRKISKHSSYFYYLNCLHSFRKKSKLGSHKGACENKIFCNIAVDSEDTIILEFSQY